MLNLLKKVRTGKKGGTVIIEPGEEKIFSAESFTLEQDGEDLIVTLPPKKKRGKRNW